ncbi:MAG TPA: carbonic anhydrase [Gemmatimonadota bacterium]|nr:carbonic anhydrase [Gemmatimonadota bacterium]
MSRLIPVERPSDIPSPLRGSPTGRLLEFHNLEREFDVYERAEILIGMCMDNRKQLRLPDQFAYILRAGGANLLPSEFKVSYAVAVGGIRWLALIGHTNCGMSGLSSRRGEFVRGLVDAGWEPADAADHFDRFAPEFEIGDPVEFVSHESARLAKRYPAVTVTPMIYRVEDGRLYLVRPD